MTQAEWGTLSTPRQLDAFVFFLTHPYYMANAVYYNQNTYEMDKLAFDALIAMGSE